MYAYGKYEDDDEVYVDDAHKSAHGDWDTSTEYNFHDAAGDDTGDDDPNKWS